MSSGQRPIGAAKGKQSDTRPCAHTPSRRAPPGTGVVPRGRGLGATSSPSVGSPRRQGVCSHFDGRSVPGTPLHHRQGMTAWHRVQYQGPPARLFPWSRHLDHCLLVNSGFGTHKRARTHTHTQEPAYGSVSAKWAFTLPQGWTAGVWPTCCASETPFSTCLLSSCR